MYNVWKGDPQRVTNQIDGKTGSMEAIFPKLLEHFRVRIQVPQCKSFPCGSEQKFQ